MTLRSDKVSGVITMAFGILMIGFATFALFIVAMQRVIIAVMEAGPAKADADKFLETMQAVHRVWFTYLPIMIAGGVVFAVAGYYLSRGSLTARRIAQANAIAGYVWLAAYIMSCYPLMDDLMPQGILPAPVRIAFKWFTLIFGTLQGAAFPTLLLFLLSRPRQQIDGAT